MNNRFTYGEASRSMKQIYLLLFSSPEKFPIGGHRGQETSQFNVIDHYEIKYGVYWPPGGAIYEIGG